MTDKTWVSFNVNGKIRFRLTAFGSEKLAEMDAELNRFVTARGGNPLKPRYTPDAEGWCETQLWCLMQDLGEYCAMGRPMPFETTIELERMSEELGAG